MKRALKLIRPLTYPTTFRACWWFFRPLFGFTGFCSWRMLSRLICFYLCRYHVEYPEDPTHPDDLLLREVRPLLAPLDAAARDAKAAAAATVWGRFCKHFTVPNILIYARLRAARRFARAAPYVCHDYNQPMGKLTMWHRRLEGGPIYRRFAGAGAKGPGLYSFEEEFRIISKLRCYWS